MKLEGNVAVFEQDDMCKERLIVPPAAKKVRFTLYDIPSAGKSFSKIREIDFGNAEEIEILDKDVLGNVIDCSICRAAEKIEHIFGQKLKKVPAGAFISCKMLKTVILPEVDEIGDDAFNWDDKLEMITVPKIKRIGARAFANCNRLSRFKFPKELQQIGMSAFFNSGIRNIEILGDTIVADRAFSQCNELEKANLKDAENISECAFEGCSHLHYIKLEKNSSIRGRVFSAAYDYCLDISGDKHFYVSKLGKYYEYCQKIIQDDIGAAYILKDGRCLIWMVNAIVYKGEDTNKILFDDALIAIKTMNASVS